MTDCDVCIGGCEEPMEMLLNAQPKCRKAFKCCECGLMVPVGDEYEKHVGKYEGQILTYRTCLLCVEIRNVFTCGKGWMYGSLWEELEEYGFDRLTTASPCFTKLSAKAKAFTLERWRTWKGLA